MVKHKVMLGLLAFFLSLISSVFAYGQQSIIGIVQDKTSVPIAGATLKLESSLLIHTQEITANSDGSFVFLNLAPGNYQITASVPDYQNKVLQFTLAPRSNLLIDLKLEISSNMLDVVEVKDKLLIDETQSTSLSLANTDFINVLPLARKNNLPDLISAISPNAVASHDNFVHFRGNELSLNTSLNGVSFLDNPHQYFAGGLPPDVIQSFTVLSGGFAAEYGNRFGGVVDAVTRSGFDRNNQGSISFGSGNFLRTNVSIDYGGHTKNFGYFLYAAGSQSQRFVNPPEEKELHSFGKGLRTFAQFDYKPNSANTLRLALINSGSNFQIPNTLEDEINGRDLLQRSREQTAILTYERKLSANSLLVTSLYERLASSRLVPTSDPVSIQALGLRNNITTGLRSDYTHIFGARHTLKTGLELTLYRLREDFFFDSRNPIDLDIERNKDEEGFPLPSFNFRARETGGSIAFYLQDKIKLSSRFTANVGLRYDQYSLVTSENELSPRINLSYVIKPQSTSVFFSYNRFFAPPPIENLLLSSRLFQTALPDSRLVSSPPRPSKSNLFELGVTQVIKSKQVIKLSLFYRDDKRSFELVEFANVRYFLPSTFVRGRAYGLELSLQIPEIPRLGISGYFNYAAQRAFQFGDIIGGFSDEVLEGLEDSEAGKQAKTKFKPNSNPNPNPNPVFSSASTSSNSRMPAIFDQIHTGTAGLMWREHHSGFWANLSFEYGSGTPQVTGGRLEEHLVVNFYAGVDLIKRDRGKVTVQLNVENLTNRVFAVSKESEFTPLQFSNPRYFSGNVKISF